MPWWSESTVYFILLLAAVYVVAFAVGFYMDKVIGD